MMWRWLRQGAPPGRWARYRLTARDWDLYWDHRGNVSAVWRSRRDPGEPTPTLRTFDFR